MTPALRNFAPWAKSPMMSLQMQAGQPSHIVMACMGGFVKIT